MKILAFDTSSVGFSVALAQNGEIISQNIITESGRQSEFLISEIEKILRHNSLWYQDLDLITTTNGPGSFTGTRIGLTTARTIKLATNLPLFLVNSCAAIAYKYHKNHQNIFVILDAKAGDFFYSYNNVTPQLAKLEDLSNILPQEHFFLCGSGKKTAAAILQNNHQQFEISLEEDEITADLIALLAYEKSQQHQTSTKDLNPLYLRSPNITERKK